MRPNTTVTIGALAAIIVVLIIALTYLVSVDKAGAPQVAVFGASITLGMGALVTLLARSQGDAVQAATTTAIMPPPMPALTAADIAAIVRAELDADRQRSAV